MGFRTYVSSNTWLVKDNWKNNFFLPFLHPFPIFISFSIPSVLLSHPFICSSEHHSSPHKKNDGRRWFYSLFYSGSRKLHFSQASKELAIQEHCLVGWEDEGNMFLQKTDDSLLVWYGMSSALTIMAVCSSSTPVKVNWSIQCAVLLLIITSARTSNPEK
jgi:hypothetical protein